MASSSAASAFISPSASSSGALWCSKCCASRIFTDATRLLLPKLEADSNAIFGVIPKRRTCSAASTADWQICDGFGSSVISVSAMKKMPLVRISTCSAAAESTPGRSPITSSTCLSSGRKRGTGPASNASASPQRTIIDAITVGWLRSVVRAA